MWCIEKYICIFSNILQKIFIPKVVSMRIWKWPQKGLQSLSPSSLFGSFDCDCTQLWEINLKFQLQTTATKVMISLSLITYFVYFDDYFVSLKKYSCHANIIFYPRGWNIFIYMEN
jgi:hypothetical protein